MTTHRLIRIASAFACVAVTMMSAACDDAPPSPVGPSTFRGPAVTSVSPNAGVSEVATTVRIEGERFLPGATVTMDGVATNVVVVNNTTITATTPAHVAGAVAVVVTNPDGKRSSLPGASFTFADLAVTSVAPVAARPGSAVRILGKGFSAGAAVTIGGVAARVVSSNVISSIDVIAPDHDAGSVDVVVTNPDGRNITLTGAFRFTTITISVSANVVAAGDELTVSWVVPDQGEPSGVRLPEDAIALWNIKTNQRIWDEETTGTSSGTRTINAPNEPGQYEFRYRDFTDFTHRDIGRSSVITVNAAAPSGSRPQRP